MRTATLVAAVRTHLGSPTAIETRDYLTMRERVVTELGAARAEARRQPGQGQFPGHAWARTPNPLAAIGVASLCLTDQSSAGRSEAVVVIVRRQVQHLTARRDLLDVSRIMSGKITLQRAPVDLREAVRQCIESRQTAAARAHDVSLAADADPVVSMGMRSVWNDHRKPPGQCHQVLTSRDTDSSACAQEDGQAVLRVQDRALAWRRTCSSPFRVVHQVKTSLHRVRATWAWTRCDTRSRRTSWRQHFGTQRRSW